MIQEQDKIRLIDEITVRLVQKMGGDHMVVAAAKVSTTGEEALDFADPWKADANAGLIDYLIRHRHGTVFEHALLTFFVHAPAFVWWEWVRHRIAHSFNLESSRYKKLEPVFWVPKLTRKLVKAPDHKSARPSFVADEAIAKFARHTMEMAYLEAYRRYEGMIEAEIANEVARAVLPFAVYFSGWVTVNPRSLMAFLSLRTHEPEAKFPSYPQAEIEQAARVTEQFLAEGWPLTYASFVKNGRVAP
jgi:thymidylate synthase (FAD)